MHYTTAFTLLRAPSALVRVEPPDVVIVEQPFARQFRCSEVRECSPMLVRVYRERHDAAYVAPNDEDIVIRFRLDGSDAEVLGPYVWRDGMALAQAINLARRELLFAVPGFSVATSADGASLVIDTASSVGRTAVPVPTANLVELAMRDDDRISVRHAIATQLAPSSPRWLELRFAGDPSWLLGPFSASDAATLALAFRGWRAEHPRDAEPTDVDVNELVANPAAWHARRIRSVGEWHFRFEHSRFANVWLQPPERRVGYGTHRVRVVGTWIYPDANARDGYGHLGCWPGELRAETLEII